MKHYYIVDANIRIISKPASQPGFADQLKEMTPGEYAQAPYSDYGKEVQRTLVARLNAKGEGHWEIKNAQDCNIIVRTL